MTRIGIVGSDNSHAIAFSKLCNVLSGELHVEGASVVALFGLDAARNREVATEGKIPTTVERPEDMIGMVDAVLVVFRHGGLHRQYAEPFLRAKIPTFIDKPLAISTADARALLDLAATSGTPLTSFSTLRYAVDMRGFVKDMGEKGKITSAVFSGPADRKSEYGGLPFYGIHTVEMMEALHGAGVKRVHAVEREKTIVVTAEYEDDRIVTLNFLGDAAYVFHMLAFAKDGWISRALDASTCYRDGLEVVLGMVRTGTVPLAAKELFEPVAILTGIEKSLATGRAVDIERL